MRSTTHRKRLSSLLSLILALNMVLSLFPVTAFASDAETIEPTEAAVEPAEQEESEADSEAPPAAEEEESQEPGEEEEETLSPETEQAEQPEAPVISDTSEPEEQPAEQPEAQPIEQPEEQPVEAEEEPEFTVAAAGLTEDAVLTVRKLDGSDRDDADQLAELQKQLSEQRIYDVFEIELEEGSILDEEKGAEVTLKGYEIDDEEHTVLIHFLEDGTTETLDYIYDKDDKEITFTAISFSPFAFAEKLEEPAAVKPAKAPALAAAGTAPEVQTIENLSVQLISGATLDGDNMVWTAANSNADHRFTYRFNYASSGQKTLPVGSFVVTLPKSILTDRDGNPADVFDLPVPEENAVSEKNEFVYKVDGDQIIIYNCVEISAGKAGTIEFSYLTSKRTTEYVDMQQFDGPEVTLTVTNGETTVSESASGPAVAINTTARVTAVKHVPTFYSDWQSSWVQDSCMKSHCRSTLLVVRDSLTWPTPWTDSWPMNSSRLVSSST